MNKIKNFFKSKYFDRLLTITIIILGLYLIITKFVGSISNVEGTSMLPSLQNNQKLVYRNSYNNFKRFDIALIKVGDKLQVNDQLYSSMHGENIVKRIIGLENETVKIEGDKLYINNKIVKQNFNYKPCGKYVINQNNAIVDNNICKQTIKIPTGYVYVLGDNRSGSTDSRFIGPIKKDAIWGIALNAKLK